MNRLSLAAATAAMVAVLGAMGYGGYWLLVHPGNIFTQLFAAKITATDARVITGPYPLEADLSLLKSEQVVLIVSLLNPSLPYERVLLDQEAETVKRLGMRFQNFPMGSILGRRVGPAYEENAALAADAVAKEKGKVYMHCYLGMHRVKVVAGLVSKRGAETGEYLLRRGQRSEDQRALDHAQALYESGKYAPALKVLDGVKIPNSAGRLLRAWVEFHMEKTEIARREFEELLRQEPGLHDAQTGMGYCCLRGGDLPSAQKYFSQAIGSDPKDVSARIGRGLARERLSDDSGAEQDMSAALKLEPGNADAVSALRRLRAAARIKK